MESKLKVVNLCTNQILTHAIKRLFSNCTDIDYYEVPSDQIVQDTVPIAAPDLFILEEADLDDLKIQKLMRNYHSCSIYINLTKNEIMLHQRKQIGVERPNDLIDIIRKCI